MKKTYITPVVLNIQHDDQPLLANTVGFVPDPVNPGDALAKGQDFWDFDSNDPWKEYNNNNEFTELDW